MEIRCRGILSNCSSQIFQFLLFTVSMHSLSCVCSSPSSAPGRLALPCSTVLGHGFVCFMSPGDFDRAVLPVCRGVGVTGYKDVSLVCVVQLRHVTNIWRRNTRGDGFHCFTSVHRIASEDDNKIVKRLVNT